MTPIITPCVGESSYLGEGKEKTRHKGMGGQGRALLLRGLWVRAIWEGLPQALRQCLAPGWREVGACLEIGCANIRDHSNKKEECDNLRARSRISTSSEQNWQEHD